MLILGHITFGFTFGFIILCSALFVDIVFNDGESIISIINAIKGKK